MRIVIDWRHDKVEPMEVRGIEVLDGIVHLTLDEHRSAVIPFHAFDNIIVEDDGV